MVEAVYTHPTKGFWTWRIDPPYWPGHEKGLVEEAPLNDETRANYKLVDPILKVLENIPHNIVIDRGDFGDGDEVFYITIEDRDEHSMFERERLQSVLDELTSK